jgi:uncharacterized protein YjiS (DUF1127 family)
MTMVHSRSVPRAAARWQSPAIRLMRFVTLLRSWIRRMQQRHELAELSDEQLRDVGLSRHMVKREAEKPFWMA